MKQKLHKSFNGLFKILTIGLLFAVLCTSSGFAQTTVEIGTDTYTGQALPMDPYYRYSYSQSIFLQSEINQSGDITKLRYNYNGNEAQTHDIVVYMGHTSETEFASTSSWIDVSTLTEVYRGPYDVTTTAGLHEIILTTPFAYDNTRNLVIAFDENEYEWGSGSSEFYCTTAPGSAYMSIVFCDDSSNPDPASPPISGTSRKYRRPNIQLDFASALPNDAGVVAIAPAGEFAVGVKDVTATIQNFGVDNLTSATISWSVNGITQTDYSWTGNLATNETAQVTLGQYDFATEGTYTINVSTSLPNGVADEKTANDTLSIDVNAVVPITSFPWIENFDAGASIPTGWVNEKTDDVDWMFMSSTTSSGGAITADNSGTGYFAFFNAYNFLDYNEGLLSSPLLDLSSLDVATLEFYWQRPNSGYNERLIVNVYSNGTWHNDLIADLNNQVSTWTKVELDLTPYISDGMRIQFKVISDNNSNIAIDDVQISGYSVVPDDAGIISIDTPVGEIATGVKDVMASIKNFGTSNLTQATIAWSVNGTPQPDYSWTGNLAQGESASIAVGSYDFATEGVYSIYASTSMPNGVTDVNIINDAVGTDVTAIQPISAFPWIEDFENAGTIPDGWVNEATNTVDWNFSSDFYDYYGGSISADNTSGTGYFAYVKCYGSGYGKVAELTSPLLDLSALSNAMLEFYWQRPKAFDNSRLEINIYSNGTWYNDVILDLNTQVTSWEKIVIDLASYISDAVKIQFKVTGGYNDKNIGLDDIKIYEPAPMVYESSTSTQVTETLPLGAKNAQIMAIEVVSSGEANPINATEFTFNTNGTTDIADIENARLWFTGTSAIFETSKQFGVDIAVLDGEFSIVGDTILAEGTNYFWLTYDIKGSATSGNFVDAECTSITVAGNAVTPNVTAPTENKEIDNYMLMPSGIGNTITNCSFTLYDDGGLSAYYSENFNGELTIYPENPGDAVKIEFVSFNTESGFDYFYIYNGNSTSEPLIGQYDGYNSNLGTFSSTADDGSLTIKFNSDGGTEKAGWEANVTCYTVVPMTYNSSTTTQNTEEVSYDSSNEHIIGIEVVTSGNYPLANITEFILNTNGSTNVADIDAARLWYTGTSNVFDTTNQFGSDIIAPDGEFTITGDTTLAEGTNYFWLTYDISVDAGRDNFIDAECDSLLIDGTYHIPSVTAPIGNRSVVRTMNMQPGTHSVTACDMIFYDEGGADDIYPSLSDGTITFYPSTPGAGIRIEFLEFDLGKYNDYLTIHNGSSTYAPILAELSDADTVLYVFESTSTDGSLTLDLDADGVTSTSDPSSGWKAHVSCYTMEEMTLTSVTTIQENYFASQNTIENVVASVEIETSGYAFPFNVSEFVFNTNGTTNSATDISNAKLWYTGNDSTFKTNKQFGSVVAAPNGEFTIIGEQNLESGKNYFWLTYDINAGATIGNIVDAVCDSIKLNGNYEIPAVTAPEGEIEIAKVYSMINGVDTITDCGYILTDDGGINGNYTYGFEGVVTLNPTNPNDVVAIDFYSFELKDYDSDHYIEIYQGDTVRAEALIGTFKYYSDMPGRYVSTALDGSLTLKFVSDYSSYTPTYEGFVAGVSCLSSDATLTDILIGGTSLEGFDQAITNYNVILENGTSIIPTVDYVLADSRSEVTKLVHTETPGAVIIKVTAENGNYMEYTINFTEEKAPVAANVMLLGTPQVGQTLTALYDYYDENGAEEGVTSFKWYRADDNQGLNKTEITGETTLTYTLVEDDNGKYITFEVTPVALTGMLTGTPVETTVGPILPPPSPENSILTFDFNELDPVVIGEVNETEFTIALTVPYGTNLNELVPTITVSDKASVSPESGETQNFTNDVVYTVTAENGDEQTYTVSVTIGQNTENSILTFDFNELDPAVIGVINEEAKTISLEVPYGTDITTLEPTITVSAEAIVSPETGVAQDFTNDVVYTVTSQSGDKQTYTVSVTVALNDENHLLSFAFADLNPAVEAQSIDHIKGKINITVPYGIDITALVPTITISAGASISPETGIAQDFTNNVEYIVTAENGDEKKYTVYLTIEPNIENSILTFDFEEFDPTVVGSIEDTTITLVVVSGDGVTALVPTITVSEEATVYPESGVAQDFTNDVVYTVTAQNGDTQEYVVKVDFNTGVDMYFSDQDINVYPNPNNGMFKLQVNIEKLNNFDIEVVNIQGKVVYRNKFTESENEINISEFANGIYYIRIIADDNIITKKVLVQ